MKRFLAALQTDVKVQFRNRLYSLGIGVGIVIAIGLSQLASDESLRYVIPALMLIVVGGSTMVYVGGMIIFERDDRTLDALNVSPLRPAEYLWAKIISLSTLATIESIVMIGGAMLIMKFSGEITLPRFQYLIAGIAAIGIIYTLLGIILIVRFDKITDFLFPMAAAAVILQLPAFYFLGLVRHPVLLAIPTSAPTVLIQGAYVELTAGEMVYSIGYTSLLIAALTLWAFRAYDRHMVSGAG